MHRDKDYVATSENLLFNVIGYEHPPGGSMANLKYVDGSKWKAGYPAALEFLKQTHPDYVTIDGRILVPDGRVTCVWRPQQRLRELRHRESNLSRLAAISLELVDELCRRLELSPDDFGLTDSLLWSDGGPDSDIDLAIYGDTASARLLHGAEQMFASPLLTRLTSDNSSRDAQVRRTASPLAIARRHNKGVFRDVRFSIRAVRDPAPPAVHWRPLRKENAITLRITDDGGSLFFPAVYETDRLPIVTFVTAHECLLRVGDVIEATGTVEAAENHGERLVVNHDNGLRIVTRVS